MLQSSICDSECKLWQWLLLDETLQIWLIEKYLEINWFLMARQKCQQRFVIPTSEQTLPDIIEGLSQRNIKFWGKEGIFGVSPGQSIQHGVLCHHVAKVTSSFNCQHTFLRNCSLAFASGQILLISKVFCIKRFINVWANKRRDSSWGHPSREGSGQMLLSSSSSSNPTGLRFLTAFGESLRTSRILSSLTFTESIFCSLSRIANKWGSLSKLL